MKDPSKEKPAFLHVLGAPRRYMEFLVVSASTNFFEPCDETGSGEQDCGPSACSSCHQSTENNASILAVVFPPACIRYFVSVAVDDVIRYTFLLQTVGVSTAFLPLVVGAVDSILAGMDVFVRIHGRWDKYKAQIVGKRLGPSIAAFLYGIGVFILCSGSAILGCKGEATISDATEHSGAENRAEQEGQECASYRTALIPFVLGSFAMSMGLDMAWNVWNQVFKHQANMRLVRETVHLPNASNSIDFQGKMAQVQVLLRYVAASCAPLGAAWLLSRTGPIISYSLVCMAFLAVCTSFRYVVGILEGMEPAEDRVEVGQKENRDSGPRSEKRRTELEVVRWSEMLPKGFLRFVPTVQETSPLLPKENKSGRFSNAFFHLGMFSCLTESVRGGYTRIVCLRAVTSDLSQTDLAQILSLVGGVATGLFWLSDIADNNRRLAAFLSFLALGIGHFGLAASSSMMGFYLSGVAFGLGEATSTGLRALIKQDYLSEDGPIGRVTEDAASAGGQSGKTLRRQVCNKINVWSDVTLVVNAFVVGVVGHYMGMRTASFAYGFLAIYATYFVTRVMPNTKPGSLSEEDLSSELP